MSVEEIEKCRICGNTELVTVIDLDQQALSGHFPRIGSPDPPVAPLKLVQCSGRDYCNLVQLSHSMPLDLLYGPHYGYLSGLNANMKKHLEGIADEVEKIVALEKGDIIIDIGSNDGTLLKAYKKNFVLKIGFDGGHFSKYYKGTGIKFFPEFFRGFSVKAKAITSIAMFYDLPDPNEFVHNIKETLHQDGVWIFEQSYLPIMIEKNAFDTICHEHIEYYCLKQIKYLLDKNGLKIFDVRFTDTNGGSIMVFACHQENKRPYNKTVGKIIEGENRHGYDIGAPFKSFIERIENIRNSVTTFLKAEKEKGKTIHLYGASTKGNVLLQYFGIDYRTIYFAAERNASKYGCRTPATHINIMSEEFSRECHPDYYLVLPWHFRAGFVEQMKEYLDNGGQLIFPLPEPEIVKIKDGKIITNNI